MMKTIYKILCIGSVLFISLGVQAQRSDEPDIPSRYNTPEEGCAEIGGSLNKSKSYSSGYANIYVCELPNGREVDIACEMLCYMSYIPETRVDDDVIVPEDDEPIVPPVVPDPEDDPTPTPTTVACTSVPSFAHFTVESDCSNEELSFIFTPKGSGNIALHVNLKSTEGRDILSAWCTGEESLCKAVGNGKACSGTDYTGTNAWCYQAN